MLVALASVGFINRDVEYNKNKIISIMEKYKGKADLLVFGETFLQGFEALEWDYSKDKHMAVSQDSSIIAEICQAAKINKLAVSLGYLEREADSIYSSQLFIGSEGTIINNYRRISEGWKDEKADFHYCEGKGFSSFTYMGKILATGLCGDLWYDDNADRMKEISADIILWPVYTDFNYLEWNETIKYEYADQANRLGKCVLLVNSVCLGVEDDCIAKGGAAFFKDGHIEVETPAGEEKVLVIEI